MSKNKVIKSNKIFVGLLCVIIVCALSLFLSINQPSYADAPGMSATTTVTLKQVEEPSPVPSPQENSTAVGALENTVKTLDKDWINAVLLCVLITTTSAFIALSIIRIRNSKQLKGGQQ